VISAPRRARRDKGRTALVARLFGRTAGIAPERRADSGDLRPSVAGPCAAGVRALERRWIPSLETAMTGIRLQMSELDDADAVRRRRAAGVDVPGGG
jgi:hypothetical protein